MTTDTDENLSYDEAEFRTAVNAFDPPSGIVPGYDPDAFAESLDSF